MLQAQPRSQSFNYTPRAQFLPYHERAQRYACIIAHRRCGKTYALLNDMIVRALVNRPDGLRQQFALMAPTQSQARAISWQYLKEQTACFSHLPSYKVLEQHLTVTLPDPRNANLPGSTIMLVGAENAERLRGLFLDGVVIDEAADVPPFVVKDIIRPALADRQGWLTVSGTVKSVDDYLWTTYELSQKLPLLWFSAMLKASETGVLPQEELDDLRSGMTEESYQIEFECNITAAVSGRILLPYLNPVQVTAVPYDSAGSAVMSAWDLGISDSMSIWTAQVCGKEVHLLDFYQNTGAGLDHYVQWLRDLKYSRSFGAHLMPHDTKVRELGTGVSRLQTLRNMGMRNIKIVPKLPKDQQIDAARMLLGRCWFNEDTTIDGRRALRNYSFSYDKRLKVFSKEPLHNEYSNPADSFQTLAVGLKQGERAITDTLTATSPMSNKVLSAPYEMDHGI